MRGAKLTLMLLALLLLSVSVIAQALKPAWVATGKYAEYELTIQSNYPYVPSGKYSIRWEIEGVHDDHAEISITSNVPAEAPIHIPTITEWYYNEDLGLFILCSETLDKLARGEKPFFGIASVTSELKGTSIGIFDCYKLLISFSVLGYSYHGYIWFDKSTGILITTTYTVERYPHQITMDLQLISTNVAMPTINILLWAVIGVIAVTSVAIPLVLLRVKRAKIRHHGGKRRTPQPLKHLYLDLHSKF
ncbi:MAG: hypothetical protein N3F04_00060 [Candidatus Nezhaarchaeota archaeon]|nr:hypothetical protein [Candidatus Nezhaarchaeota archaeon]MCX8141167.1 hypothetical protein [Candidatus Nezhaarchaeota archaeon]MDW8050830.1 hypothetical protein [Nitrososphaerota archaeon]